MNRQDIDIVRLTELVYIFHFPVRIFGDKIGLPKYPKLECGTMPNLMVALPNIGGALCSTPQTLADAHY